jgi:hypothetical protein
MRIPSPDLKSIQLKTPAGQILEIDFRQKKLLEIEIQLWQHFCPEASATRKRPLPIGVN